MLGEAHPLLYEAQLVVGEAHPLLDEAHPLLDEAHPLLDEVQLVVGEAHPLLDEAHSLLDEAHPLLDEDQPVVGEAQAVADKTQYVVQTHLPKTKRFQRVKLITIQRQWKTKFLRWMIITKTFFRTWTTIVMERKLNMLTQMRSNKKVRLFSWFYCCNIKLFGI